MISSGNNCLASIPNSTTLKTNLVWESKYLKFPELDSSKKEKCTLTISLSKPLSRNQ